MAVQADLGAFLRARRERVRPADVGLPEGLSRRTPGLRRQEVAQLAGMSVEYYVRLEQGRGGLPSAEVLDALATTLRLDPAARGYLFDLVEATRPARRRPARQRLDIETVAGSTRRFLAAITEVPAVVLGRSLDVLAWNDPFTRVFYDPTQAGRRARNAARFVFLDPLARTLYRNWEQIAHDTIAMLRTAFAAAGCTGDAPCLALPAELAAASPEFDRWWNGHDVDDVCTRKELNHPRVGLLRLDHAALALADSPGQRLVTYLPADDDSAAALATLLRATSTQLRLVT